MQYELQREKRTETHDTLKLSFHSDTRDFYSHLGHKASFDGSDWRSKMSEIYDLSQKLKILTNIATFLVTVYSQNGDLDPHNSLDPYGTI